jgi:hypothetical protein
MPPTVRLYYVTMAILDIIQLLSEHLLEFFGIGVPKLNDACWVPEGNTGVCKAMRYLCLATECGSNWILAVFCFECLVVVIFPLKAISIVKTSRARVSVFLVLAYSCFVASSAILNFQSTNFRFSFCCSPVSNVSCVFST